MHWEADPRYLDLTRHLNGLPGWLAGYAEWYLFRALRGGVPFNGQAKRMELFQQVAGSFPFRAIVETGTFRGLTTVAMRRVSGLPVHTVEAFSRSYRFARSRFRGETGIHAEYGDSRAFLARLAKDPRFPHDCVFFYLDAHGEADLPLYEELEVVARHWTDPVIMIDDFQVPDDPAYIFDDYGIGRRLTFDYLPAKVKREFRLFWPAAPGEEETGSRRGCVVAGRRGAASQTLARLPLLRETICCG